MIRSISYTLHQVITIVAILLFVTGCDEPSSNEIQEAKARTAHSFENPELIATLPDGRSVYRSQVEIVPDDTFYNHYVYYVGCATTTNRKIQRGKLVTIETTVDLTGCIPNVTTEVSSP